MSEKLIQIVDDNDQPIGSATIDEAHLKGLTARIARVMVEDSKGNILLQRRTTNMSVYPSCWDNSAAGHVDLGESYEIAAARELAEEVGIKNITLKDIGSYFTSSKYHNRILKRFNKVYKTTVKANTKLTLQADEVSDARWFTVGEIKKLIAAHPEQVTDGLADVFEKYYLK